MDEKTLTCRHCGGEILNGYPSYRLADGTEFHADRADCVRSLSNAIFASCIRHDCHNEDVKRLELRTSAIRTDMQTISDGLNAVNARLDAQDKAIEGIGKKLGDVAETAGEAKGMAIGHREWHVDRGDWKGTKQPEPVTVPEGWVPAKPGITCTAHLANGRMCGDEAEIYKTGTGSGRCHAHRNVPLGGRVEPEPVADVPPDVRKRLAAWDAFEPNAGKGYSQPPTVTLSNSDGTSNAETVVEQPVAVPEWANKAGESGVFHHDCPQCDDGSILWNGVMWYCECGWHHRPEPEPANTGATPAVDGVAEAGKDLEVAAAIQILNDRCSDLVGTPRHPLETLRAAIRTVLAERERLEGQRNSALADAAAVRRERDAARQQLAAAQADSLDVEHLLQLLHAELRSDGWWLAYYLPDGTWKRMQVDKWIQARKEAAARPAIDQAIVEAARLGWVAENVREYARSFAMGDTRDRMNDVAASLDTLHAHLQQILNGQPSVPARPAISQADRETLKHLVDALAVYDAPWPASTNAMDSSARRDLLQKERTDVLDAAIVARAALDRVLDPTPPSATSPGCSVAGSGAGMTSGS